ncbi:MAG: AAA family ATPase [Gammaproteobacteria bacterium]
MIPRLLSLPKNRHFLLFGPRNTGKSTLLRQIFSPNFALWLDLLDPLQEEQLTRSPGELKAIVAALPSEITHVIIDEIQKIPKLLDVVHSLIESTDKKFVLTGSSARKLRHGGANLLAGRAFVYHLYPFSFLEIEDQFELDAALRWGMLPQIYDLTTDEEKLKFLQAYTQTYLREEIWIEQFIRKLDPFRKFLEVCAQCNGKIINVNNLATDVGVDPKTINAYFSILEDTLIGFFLEPYQDSFRKRLSKKPKFYFFDTGVSRALARLLSVPLRHSTSMYGEVFEHFIILECIKLASYFKPEFRFAYLKTKDEAEIDLIVERPGLPLLCIEIKSTEHLQEADIKSFSRLTLDIPNCEAVCFSRDVMAKRYDHVQALPWKVGIKQFFHIEN